MTNHSRRSFFKLPLPLVCGFSAISSLRAELEQLKNNDIKLMSKFKKYETCKLTRIFYTSRKSFPTHKQNIATTGPASWCAPPATSYNPNPLPTNTSTPFAKLTSQSLSHMYLTSSRNPTLYHGCYSASRSPLLFNALL